ncbi:guanine nucleotide exchange factor [Anaeramoeba ignava]|uniref:Guanine nucleotide exchange factor n=1 Tax=Anaeramoeba ignava TaxID=1746090 RepID=A0A9Q0LMU3_ANAIG|nr:guanine nucleotide exchange factor [Anaeramoeba ignava]
MPLHYAVKKQNTDLCFLLLDRNANPYLKNFKGINPLKYASLKKQYSFLFVILDVALINACFYRNNTNIPQLINDGANVDGQNLLTFIQQNEIKIKKTNTSLTEKELKDISKYGFRYLINMYTNPLLATVSGQNFAAFDILISKFADIKQQDYFSGATVLHMAILRNDVKFTKILIEYNATISQMDSEGKTALQLAEEKGFTKCKNMIELFEEVNVQHFPRYKFPKISFGTFDKLLDRILTEPLLDYQFCIHFLYFFRNFMKRKLFLKKLITIFENPDEYISKFIYFEPELSNKGKFVRARITILIVTWIYELFSDFHENNLINKSNFPKFNFLVLNQYKFFNVEKFEEQMKKVEVFYIQNYASKKQDKMPLGDLNKIFYEEIKKIEEMESKKKRKGKSKNAEQTIKSSLSEQKDITSYSSFGDSKDENQEDENKDEKEEDNNKDNNEENKEDDNKDDNKDENKEDQNINKSINENINEKSNIPRSQPRGTRRGSPRGSPRGQPRGSPRGQRRGPPRGQRRGFPRGFPRGDPKEPPKQIIRGIPRGGLKNKINLFQNVSNESNKKESEKSGQTSGRRAPQKISRTISSLEQFFQVKPQETPPKEKSPTPLSKPSIRKTSSSKELLPPKLPPKTAPKLPIRSQTEPIELPPPPPPITEELPPLTSFPQLTSLPPIPPIDSEMIPTEIPPIPKPVQIERSKTENSLIQPPKSTSSFESKIIPKKTQSQTLSKENLNTLFQKKQKESETKEEFEPNQIFGILLDFLSRNTTAFPAEILPIKYAVSEQLEQFSQKIFTETRTQLVNKESPNWYDSWRLDDDVIKVIEKDIANNNEKLHFSFSKKEGALCVQHKDWHDIWVYDIFAKPEIYNIFQQEIPSSILRKKKTSKKHVDDVVLDNDSLELARQISLIEFAFFSKITPLEFRNWGIFVKEGFQKGKPKIKNVKNMAEYDQYLKNLINWVVYHIVKYPKMSKRSKTLFKLVDVAIHLRKMNNYASLVTVLEAFNQDPIARLRKTWNKLGKQQKKALQELKDELKELQLKSQYKNHYKALHPPCIPSLEHFFTDINSIESSYIDIDEKNRIQVEKFVSQFRLIEIISNFQRFPFNFNHVPEIQSAILNVPITSAQRLKEFSLLCEKEPKSKK